MRSQSFCSSWKVHLVTCWTLENGMNTVIPQTYQKLYVPHMCYLLSVYFDPRTKSCFNLVESHLRVKAAHPGPISLRSTYLPGGSCVVRCPEGDGTGM